MLRLRNSADNFDAARQPVAFEPPSPKIGGARELSGPGVVEVDGNRLVGIAGIGHRADGCASVLRPDGGRHPTPAGATRPLTRRLDTGMVDSNGRPTGLAARPRTPQETSRMAKNQAVWALDIGQAALKAIKLVPGESPDQVMAEAFDFIEYPKILSQPDADPEALVSEALGTFMDRNDLKGSKVAIAVPGQAGLVKFIKLPPVEKKRIPDIVKFEAKQQIPFALEEVVWAYQQIGDEDKSEEEEFTTVEVGLFAMKRDQINRAIQPFRAAGIEIDVVQMGPIALYNYITYDQLKGSGLKGSIVLLDIGADNTDLIISDGTRIWQRNVPIGGNHFTRALTKELKLTFAKAEHLKRNATKAPDPKAVFTAMRGIFNDFASEVNRSIGFYSSVNRQAKILKVVGLGNGFKLPGLQKFLQQNLNGLDVEKLEDFSKLTGDEVKAAPQFVENLPSFAVSYGLGLQGLGRSQLRTNLLPPEVEQVRLIRRKKPWALAASALLMLGFSALYMGAYRAYATVVNEPFKQAVERAKSVAATGLSYNTAYSTAKSEFDAKLKEGQSLVVAESERASWPKLLKLINATMPDPAAQYHLDPGIPKNVKILDLLRVHVDKIKPVYRTDVAAGWFADAKSFPEEFKSTLHPLDRKDPTGEGWIVQILCHHYNPTPIGAELKNPMLLGGWKYIYQQVLPRFWSADLRAKGIHHVALTGIGTDKQWTTESTSSASSSTLIARMLPRATPAVATTGAGGEGGSMQAMMSPGGMGGRGAYGGGAGGASYGTMMGRGPGMGGPAMGMPMGPGSSKDAQKRLLTRTRTDFLIQFIWQPPTPEQPGQPIEEIRKALVEAEKDQKNTGALSAIDATKQEEQLEKASIKSSNEIIKAQDAAIAKGAAGQPATGVTPAAPNAPATGPAPAPAAPGVAPPAPGTPPAPGASAAPPR